MLADLIHEVHALGLRVNNLFEKDDGCWQANLRDAEGGHAFGFGDSPENALWRALERAKQALATRPPLVAQAPSTPGLFD